MKVVCIDDNLISSSYTNPDIEPYGISGFTKGVIYVVERNTPTDFFLVRNDINRTSWIQKSRFLTLEEWREQRINTILNS